MSDRDKKFFVITAKKVPRSLSLSYPKGTSTAKPSFGMKLTIALSSIILPDYILLMPNPLWNLADFKISNGTSEFTVGR